MTQAAGPQKTQNLLELYTVSLSSQNYEEYSSVANKPPDLWCFINSVRPALK